MCLSFSYICWHLAHIICARKLLRINGRDWVFCFCYYSLPGMNFGQREHIFMILALPYFLSLIYDRQIFPPWMLAVPAAIGLGLKHYFGIILAALVLADAYWHKDWRRIFRTENWIIGGLLVVYAAYLFFIERDYVEQIVQWLLQYYDIFRWPILVVLQKALSASFVHYAGFVVMFIVARELVKKEMLFLAIVIFASIIVVVIQQRGWVNHYLPAYMFAVMLNIWVIYILAQNKKTLWRKVAILLAVISISSSFITASYTMAGQFFKESDSEKLVRIFNQYASGKYVYGFEF